MKAAYFFIGLLIFGCVHATPTDSYPDAWWKEVPATELKGWEIAPQQASRNNGEVILSKRTELGKFSNLAPLGFVLDGIKYGSVEGLWQGMKYPDGPNDERLKDSKIIWPFTREQVYLMTDFEAKKAGDMANANMKALNIRWITYKGEKVEYNGSGMQRHYEIILEACRSKVAQNPDLEKLLRSTGDLKFFPDHKQQPNPNPAYLYHEIYMKIRSELISVN